MIGQTLGHYRVVEKIGAGGVGEVYRAHDQQLDRDVALKVLPAGTLADEAARKQFRKEALALAKLNHPNIETVHDFGCQDGTDFLVMELISGHSLSQKLKEGPLSEREIVRLANQFAEGLAAAHEHGVVHRDLKPGNLMITPEGRLKILDFGLAKLVHSTPDFDATQTITTETGSVSGTVPYMSPEQLRGRPTDVRSDIYAAGAVLYEMATGQRPFPQMQGPQLMGAILHQTPAPPRSLNQDVPPGLESVILKALEKESSQRYQSARELLVALEGLSTGVAPAIAHKRPGWPLVIAGATALSIVLLVGLVFGLNLGGLRERLLQRGSSENSAASLPRAPIHPRRSVAVIGFKNLSGRQDEAWLSTALSEMLTTELAAGGRLRTIPGENVAQMKISLALPDADSYGKETLAKIRKSLGSDHVVLGSYLAMGTGDVRLDLKLEDASTGEIVDSVTENGKEQQVSDLVSLCGSSLRAKLGAGEVTPAEAAAVKATLPSNPEAAKLYSAGLAKLRVWDTLAARDLCQKTLTVEPNFALAHSALASAWSGLGYDQKAKDEAKKAFDLSASLSKEDRQAIEARYLGISHQDDKAVEIYKDLFRAFPDNLDYGLHLAGEQIWASKYADAHATLAVLRRLPGPSGEDPRIDIYEATAADHAADYKRLKEVAARAASKAETQGARLLQATALVLECGGSFFLGESKDSEGLCEQARQIFTATGDWSSAAWADHNIGNILDSRGDFAGALRTYEKSLATYRRIGNQGMTAVEQYAIGRILANHGDLAQATSALDEALKNAREVGDKTTEGFTLNLMGYVLLRAGHLERANDVLQQSLAKNSELGHKMNQAYTLQNLAYLSLERGDLTAMKSRLDQALALMRETGDKSGLGDILSAQGDLLDKQGDLASARKKKEETLSMAKEVGADLEVAAMQVDLASITIDEGHPGDAEAPLRTTLKRIREKNESPNTAVGATIYLADSLLKQGNVLGAQKELSSVAPLAAKSEEPETRLEFAFEAARAKAAQGDPRGATKSLEKTLAEAQKYGFVPDEFEAQLALGEVEMKSGKAAAGRARLAALEKDATRKGFLLIARKAAAAAR